MIMISSQNRPIMLTTRPDALLSKLPSGRLNADGAMGRAMGES